MEGEAAPDRNDEYLFYQALLGAWPAESQRDFPPSAPAELIERLRAYMLKAVREAKVHTSWISPNDAYDQAVGQFVEQTLSGPPAAGFLASFLPFQQRVAVLGMINSLAQLILKMTSPGVPDLYQGAELWDLSLVDPDNRRPVNYTQRLTMLNDLEPRDQSPHAPPLSRNCCETGGWPDRLSVNARVCGRRRYAAVGTYVPLTAEGNAADHVIALPASCRSRPLVVSHAAAG